MVRECGDRWDPNKSPAHLLYRFWSWSADTVLLDTLSPDRSITQVSNQGERNLGFDTRPLGVGRGNGVHDFVLFFIALTDFCTSVDLGVAPSVVTDSQLEENSQLSRSYLCVAPIVWMPIDGKPRR